MENQWNSHPTLCENIFTSSHRQEFEIPNVLAVIGDVKGKTVLDFGCGPANYSRLIKINGAEKVTGYDISEEMVKCAREREEKENLGIEYVSTLTPDLCGRFDLVLTAFVLPYAPSRDDLHTMCSDMGRLLRPAGRLVAVTFNPYDDTSHPDDGEEQVLEFGEPSNLLQFKIRVWSKSVLETALRHAGFCQIEWRKAAVYGPCPVEDAPDFVRDYLEKPSFAILECFLSE